MRTVYLICHGEPAFPNGEKLCISRTDLPLSSLGLMQCIHLKKYFESIILTGVYHCGLKRTSLTAAAISEKNCFAEGWEEFNFGRWEGLSIREIRKEYPALCKQREIIHIHFQIPEGEFPSSCRNRVTSALHSLLYQTKGDIAIIGHKNINRFLLCDLLNMPLKSYHKIPQPYGCINVLHVEDRKISVEAIGVSPN